MRAGEIGTMEGHPVVILGSSIGPSINSELRHPLLLCQKMRIQQKVASSRGVELLAFEQELAWKVESHSVISYRHGGRVLNTHCQLWDSRGYLSACSEALFGNEYETAKRMYGVGSGSTLEVAVEGFIEIRPCLITRRDTDGRPSESVDIPLGSVVKDAVGYHTLARIEVIRQIICSSLADRQAELARAGGASEFQSHWALHNIATHLRRIQNPALKACLSNTSIADAV